MNMSRLVNHYLLQPMFNLLYPPVCWLCDRLLKVPEQIVCLECLNKLTPYNYSDNTFQQEVHVFDDFYILYEFDETLRRLVHLFKYKQCKGLADVFAQKTLELCASITPLNYSCVVAVPLHPARERERGYNQSALLAKQLAERSGIKYDFTVLSRIRATPSQTKLSRTERQRNVTGAFAVIVKQEIGRALLVDDVITTGSTVDACVQVLKRAGIKTVDVLALANPVPGHDHPTDR